MQCCLDALFCYVDVTPCVVEPTQQVDNNIALFDRARIETFDNTHYRGVTGGGIACGNFNLTEQEAADRTINRDYSGVAGGPAIWRRIGAGGAPDYDMLLTLEFDAPRDFVGALRFFDGYGGILNDNDGFATGVAQVRVYDATNTLIATETLVTLNAAAPGITNFTGAPLMGVRRIEIDGLRGRSAGCAGLREIDITGGWYSTLFWECGGTLLRGFIQGLNDGITVSGGVLTQTNGPHTVTFIADGGTLIEGTIITDNPGMFSSLVFSDGDAVTISGDGLATFAISFVIESNVRQARFDFATGTAYDLETGLPMTIGQFNPATCP